MQTAPLVQPLGRWRHWRQPLVFSGSQEHFSEFCFSPRLRRVGRHINQNSLCKSFWLAISGTWLTMVAYREQPFWAMPSPPQLPTPSFALSRCPPAEPRPQSLLPHQPASKGELPAQRDSARQGLNCDYFLCFCISVHNALLICILQCALN